MEAPSINSRQPPDGHEFPDYQETLATVKVKDDLTSNLHNQRRNSLTDLRAKESTVVKGLTDKMSKFSRSISDCSNLGMESNYFSTSSLMQSQTQILTPRLHTRSQSLTDIKTDRWTALTEQRKKGLSKLKGLVIPENTEVEYTIDIPEIKSNNMTVPVPITELTKSTFHTKPKNNNHQYTPSSRVSPLWTSPPIADYSPAFKRKNLQMYNSKNSESEKNVEKPRPTILSFNDAPKSLESITSPTRSDSSFEYMSSSPDLKVAESNQAPRSARAAKEEVGKSDESDNDSAVSSSQSSYASRNSPPTSPNHLVNNYNHVSHGFDALSPRLLKPKSVEAVNRRNILDSTKCPSGQDIKAGSPQIHRKFDEEKGEVEKKADNTEHATKPITEKHQQKEITLDNVVLRQVKTTPKSSEPLTLKYKRNAKSVSVTDLKKTFENLAPTPPPVIKQSDILTPKRTHRLSLNLPSKSEYVTSIKSAPPKAEDFKPYFVSKEVAQSN